MIGPAGKALAVAVAVAAGAFALQALALPRPTSDQLLATQSMRWLTKQHALETTGLGRRRQVSALCFDIRLASRRLQPSLPGSLLITPRARLVETRTISFYVGRRPRAVESSAAALAALRAGCPRALERRIGRLLTIGARVVRKRVVVGRRVLLLLALGPPKRRLDLLVRPATLAPIAARIGAGPWRRLEPVERDDLLRRRVWFERGETIRIEAPA
jgi:hypothetical protein